MENFQDFYKKQKNRLFSYLMRMTGDYYLSMDIMQESFLRCLEKYRDKTLNSSLLYTIARNVFIDFTRREKRKTALEQDTADQDADIENEYRVKQEYRRVINAMKRLDTDERELLALVLTEELKYTEIASIVGINEGNVKIRVHRARLKLREFLSEGD
ncbi:MAG: RNA polymerase sigma factor [Deltaproteobacteria bacterium]|nr:RNA polymerase sigma factor [Deltaproteobacteria bacterium]